MDCRAPNPSLSRRDALLALAAVSCGAMAGCHTEAGRPEAVHRIPALPPPPAREIDLDDLALPDRRPGALCGTRFIDKTRSMSWNQREAAVLEQVLGGNVPRFLRKLTTVPISLQRGSQHHAGSVRVIPDYICIGSDEDFVRMPMNGRTAQRIASATGCVLPTTKLVDSIYDHAQYKLASTPRPHGPKMMSSGYFLEHHLEIEGHRKKLGGPLGALCAGHKKDVVISRRLEYQPRHLAIYGWHRDDNRAIQFLSTFHEDTYVDYTHGVRLVAEEMMLDGELRNVGDVLKDTELCALLSTEGPVQASYQT